MPANIAHVLIAKAAQDIIKEKNAELEEIILWKNPFLYLGSVGPDLPSYTKENLIKEAMNSLFLRPLTDYSKPVAEDLSFFLHSSHPNLIPFYLTETNVNYIPFQNGKPKSDEFNFSTLVFTFGYVCHMAADQVIHRLVRELVGPYYRDKATTVRHAECEVYQDVFLFKELLKQQAFSKTYHRHLINIDRFGFQYEGFCNLLSLTFSKAGYRLVSRADIDSWIDGMLFAFDLMDTIGPYVSAFADYEEHKDNLEDFPFYKKYYRNDSLDYMKWFDRAVEKAVEYIEEVWDLWNGQTFDIDRRIAFEQKISSEDLTSPLAFTPN